LDQDAFARLSNLAAVKPDKARSVEQLIIRLAQSGQLGGKLNDDGLKDLLNKVASQTKSSTTVKFDRRRVGLDSDDEDY
jgi:programmed cell death protein 5